MLGDVGNWSWLPYRPGMRYRPARRPHRAQGQPQRPLRPRCHRLITGTRTARISCGARGVLVASALLYAAALMLMNFARDITGDLEVAGFLAGVGNAGTGFGVRIATVSKAVRPEKRSKIVGLAAASGTAKLAEDCGAAPHRPARSLMARHTARSNRRVSPRPQYDDACGLVPSPAAVPAVLDRNATTRSSSHLSLG